MIKKIELHNIVVSILCMFKFIMILKTISSTRWITKKAAHRLCLSKVSNRLVANLYNTLGILLGQGGLNIFHTPSSSAYKLSSI